MSIAAMKLALDALNVATTPLAKDRQEVLRAQAALRQAIAEAQQMQAHQFKLCDRCETKKPPEGGIQLSNSRWYCAACWKARVASSQRQIRPH